MTDIALTAGASPKPKLDHPINPATAFLFLSILLAGILYAGLNIYWEVRDAGVSTETWLPFILLGIALLIALGFEFVNGFHDTANAVATVIYTHSLAPNIAVLWSGLWNFLGVMVSTGAVAFAIISLLPVELISPGRLACGLCHGVRPAVRLRSSGISEPGISTSRPPPRTP